VLEQQTFTIVEDEDYRYFSSMQDFMDSGLSAEIVKLDCGDEEEYVEGMNYDTHGRVLVLIRSLMMKSIPNELSEVIDIVSRKCLEKKENIKRSKDRAEKRLLLLKRESRLRREARFRFLCNISVDVELKANLVRIFYTLYLFLNREGSELYSSSVLLTLACSVI
jgi:hypothetical protein